MPTIYEEIIGLKYPLSNYHSEKYRLKMVFNHIPMPRGYIMVKLNMVKLEV